MKLVSCVTKYENIMDYGFGIKGFMEPMGRHESFCVRMRRISMRNFFIEINSIGIFL